MSIEELEQRVKAMQRETAYENAMKVSVVRLVRDLFNQELDPETAKAAGYRYTLDGDGWLWCEELPEEEVTELATLARVDEDHLPPLPDITTHGVDGWDMTAHGLRVRDLTNRTDYSAKVSTLLDLAAYVMLPKGKRFGIDGTFVSTPKPHPDLGKATLYVPTFVFDAEEALLASAALLAYTEGKLPDPPETMPEAFRPAFELAARVTMPQVLGHLANERTGSQILKHMKKHGGGRANEEAVQREQEARQDQARKDADVVRMALAGELSYAEIEEETGVKKSSVSKLVKVAREGIVLRHEDGMGNEEIKAALKSSFSPERIGALLDAMAEEQDAA